MNLEENMNKEKALEILKNLASGGNKEASYLYEQNKPRFSVKDVEDALNIKEDYMIKNLEIYIPINRFKQKLGI